jgi:hypothetical protein
LTLPGNDLFQGTSLGKNEEVRLLLGRGTMQISPVIASNIYAVEGAREVGGGKVVIVKQ